MSYKTKNDIRIDLTLLHPWLQYKINLLLNKCNKKGIYLIITEGYRTKEHQDKLYAQGRTTPGKIVTNARGSDLSSQHQWGIAFDIGIAATTPAEIYNLAMIKLVATIAKGLGLGWGGDWISPVDTPHFYLKKWGDTPTALKRTYGSFENFKRTWTATVAGTKNGLKVRRTKNPLSKVKKIYQNGKIVQVMYAKGKKSKVLLKNGTAGWVKNKYLK